MRCRRSPLHRPQGTQRLCIKRPSPRWNANDAWLIWSKLRTNRPKHSNIPDAPSQAQPLLGAALHCLAAVGSGEEYFKFLLGPKNKYITPPGSTDTETLHTGGKKRRKKKKKAADGLHGLGEGQPGYPQQNKSSPQQAPASSTLPTSMFAAAEVRTCCRYQNAWRLPKLLFAGGRSLASALFAHRCQGWKFFKRSTYLNSAEATGLRRWKPVWRVRAGARGMEQCPLGPGFS